MEELTKKPSPTVEYELSPTVFPTIYNLQSFDSYPILKSLLIFTKQGTTEIVPFSCINILKKKKKLREQCFKMKRISNKVNALIKMITLTISQEVKKEISVMIKKKLWIRKWIQRRDQQGATISQQISKLFFLRSN